MSINFDRFWFGSAGMVIVATGASVIEMMMAIRVTMILMMMTSVRVNNDNKDD